jgi:hypothetical protein
MSNTIEVGNDEFAAIFKKGDRGGHIKFTKMIYNKRDLPHLLEILFDDKEDVIDAESKKHVPDFLKGLVGTNNLNYSGGKRKNTRRKLKKRKRRKSSTKKNT